MVGILEALKQQDDAALIQADRDYVATVRDIALGRKSLDVSEVREVLDAVQQTPDGLQADVAEYRRRAQLAKDLASLDKTEKQRDALESEIAALEDERRKLLEPIEAKLQTAKGKLVNTQRQLSRSKSARTKLLDSAPEFVRAEIESLNRSIGAIKRDLRKQVLPTGVDTERILYEDGQWVAADPRHAVCQESLARFLEEKQEHDAWQQSQREQLEILKSRLKSVERIGCMEMALPEDLD